MGAPVGPVAVAVTVILSATSTRFPQAVQRMVAKDRASIDAMRVRARRGMNSSGRKSAPRQMKEDAPVEADLVMGLMVRVKVLVDPVGGRIVELKVAADPAGMPAALRAMGVVSVAEGTAVKVKVVGVDEAV